MICLNCGCLSEDCECDYKDDCNREMFGDETDYLDEDMGDK